MADLTSKRGELEKMTIVAFSDAEMKNQTEHFVVMFNPSTFSVNHTNTYDQYPQPVKGTSDQKQDHRNPRTLSLELLFDGTTSSPISGKSGFSKAQSIGTPNPDDLVDKMIEKFLLVTYDIDMNKHRTPFLAFAWGNFYFTGVMESANITYSLFTPNGKTLRAKVNISVKEHITDKKLDKELNLKSPDLTQFRTVIAGDTLPNLAKHVYGDEKLYIELAKANNLKNYRKLSPGQQITFPPIEKIKSKS